MNISFIKNNLKYILGGIILFLILIIGYLWANRVTVKYEKQEPIKKEVKEEVKDKYYKVDIKGEINSPGVYELKENSRVIDVIKMAGDLTDDADTDLINLSKKIKDEMIIIIYSKEEIKKLEKEEIKYNKKIEVKSCPDELNNSCIMKKNNSHENSNELVSINEADIKELTTLSGIGEAKAQTIIDYREENGLFEKIEDIKNVTGIGDALYEKIKDHITV